MNYRSRKPRRLRRAASPKRSVWAAALCGLPACLPAQTVNFNESFTGASAAGWVFDGNYTPWLTAGANPNGGAGFIDSPGSGWLRLTDNGGNRATSALLDTQIFSVNARIEITMDYAFWNGTGADGITFFLVDGGVNASTFSPGAYGGSMGYAQRDGVPGMPGGYLGFALDNFGNYSNGSEGRNGGITNSGTLYPNRVAVRGPESSNYEFIAASGTLPSEMDFPSYTSRPSQTGADYRSFKIVFDANNQLTVSMKFGATGDYVSVFNADLSSYERPETFKVGFTGATGGSNEIHEIRQLSVSMTPWSVADGGNEWDRGAGTTTWGATAGAANNNWFGNGSGDNKTPLAVGANSGTFPGADILFGNKPTQVGTTGGPRGGPAQLGDTETVDLGSTSTAIRSLTFDTGLNYVLDGTGTLTLGNGTGSSPQNAGIASINVNDYNGAYGLHKINTALALNDALAIRNFSFSTLCINDAIETNGRTMTVSGQGAVNFNGDISGSGALIKNGRGITTINNDNSDDPAGPLSAWTGAVTVNDGMLVVTSTGALGATSAGTTVNSGGTLAFRGGVDYATTETVTISGSGITRSTGQLAGAIHNDGGDNVFAGNVVLAGNSAIGSRDGVLELSGTLSQSGGARTLTKVGAGVVELSNSGNSWSGNTTIGDGALRISGNASALTGGFDTNDTGSNFGTLTFAGGVLDIAVGTDFTRSVGAGEEQVRWTGDGGFSASGGNRTVSLSGGNVTWNSGSFVPTGNALVLGHGASTHTLDFQNGINLGAAQREIRVVDGASNTTGAVDGRLSGVLSGTGGGINKTGSGTLELTADNTYTGETRISGGALRVSQSNRINGSDLVLNGGVLEIAGDLDTSNTGDFTRSVGTSGGDDVRWTADGGFAAVGGARTVRLNNGTGNVTWGVTSDFVAADSRLLLGSASANNTVTFANGLVLGASGNRTIRATLGTNSTIASGVLSGVVSGSANLSITGNGRLDLTAANTNNGTVSVTGAELRLRTNGTLTSVGDIIVTQGGLLTLDNGATNNTNRIGNSANVTLAGGRVDFLGRTSNNNASAESAGQLVLSSGENQININRASNTGTSSNLTFSGLTRSAGATLEVTRSGSGALGTDANLRFGTAPALEQGILAWAVAGNGATPTGFATHSGNNTAITVLAGTNTAQSSWNSSIIAAPTGNQTLTANRTVGALNLGSDVNVFGNGTFALTVQTGGILSTGATNSTLSAATLNVGGSGSRELFTHVYGNGTLTISSAIQNNSNTLGLTKSGNGTLVLSGTSANTFSGPGFVNDGTLVLGKTAGLNAIAGDANTATVDLTVGDGRGVDILRLGANEQIANDASVVLRGGEIGNALNVARFEFNGALDDGDAPRIETFHSLAITGNSILDFGGGTSCSPNFLYIDVLSVTAGSLLTVTNWVEFTDFLLVEANGVTPADLSNIVFEGYSGAASWQFYGDANGKTYWQVTPVPEPATYGLLSIGGLLGFLRQGWRRRCRNSSCLLSIGGLLGFLRLRRRRRAPARAAA